MNLSKSETSFTVIFFLILIAELFCNSLDSLAKWHIITKPAILISLIVFF